MAEFCSCNKPKVFRTSWTNDNPGRRFKMCARYRFPDGCLDFEWLDPSCPRCQAIIPGLRRRINAREDELVGVNGALAATKIELENALREKELVITENLVLVDQLQNSEEHLKASSTQVRDLEMKMVLMETEWKLKEKSMKKQAIEELRYVTKIKTAMFVLVLALVWKCFFQ